MITEIAEKKPETIESSQLITLKPEIYVKQVFDSFKRQLAKAKKDANGVTYDITTTVGMEVAKKMRASFREIRTTAENTRKERKAPIIQIGKLLDSKYQELEVEIRQHEDKYDADIKKEEKRKEDEKQRKIAEERARVEAIENRIANIRSIPNRHLQSDSATISKVIDEQASLVLNSSEYEEFLEDAINAVNASLVDLESMRKLAVTREEDARRADAERAELARLRAEREQEQKRQEEVTEAQRRKIAELEAQLAEQRSKVEAQQEPEPVLQMTADSSSISETAAPLPVVETLQSVTMPAPRHSYGGYSTQTIKRPTDNRPPITTGALCALAGEGFSVTAAFIQTLGIYQAERPKDAKSGTYWSASDVPLIFEALSKHLEKLAAHDSALAA